jgi:cytochrome P450
MFLEKMMCMKGIISLRILRSCRTLGESDCLASDEEYLLTGFRAVMHDPTVFNEPFEFKPERYLTSEGNINPHVLSPEDAAFGYGRRWVLNFPLLPQNSVNSDFEYNRICPGRHLSNETLSIMAISILACFDISPALDDAGKPKELKLEVTSSIVS